MTDQSIDAVARLTGRDSVHDEEIREAQELASSKLAEHRSSSRGLSSLFVDGVTVSFDGFRALDELSLALMPGELRCVIGPNGAGKTTLLDVITGKTVPDSGRVLLHGQSLELTGRREHEIARLGVGRKFQRPTVFDELSVLENLQLSLKSTKGVWRTLFGRLSREGRDRIEQVLGTIGLSELGGSRAGLLAHGQKQWLEIGMLLAQDPEILLIDEPVAGMTRQESERTAELLLQLAGKHTVLVVEHDMEFVRSIARTVTVLHEGRVLAEGPMARVQADPRVIEVYLGT